MKSSIKIIAGNASRPLAEAIAAYLELPLAKCMVRRFADMEIFVELQENVRRGVHPIRSSGRVRPVPYSVNLRSTNERRRWRAAVRGVGRTGSTCD